MLETRPCRIFFYSEIQEKYIMLPVKSITTEYINKNDVNIFVSVLESGKKGPVTIVKVNSTINPSILMYSSDVFDIHGKLIYEGDVLHIGDDIEECERAVVYYKRGIFSADYFSKAPPDCANGNNNAWWGEGYEPDLNRRVSASGRFRMKNIGNICENPELLGDSLEDIIKLKSIYDWYHKEEEE